MKFFFNKNSIFVISVCILFIALRFPSLFEPSWYGDEGIYQVIGHAIRDGRLLYADAWDNKPPLIYMIFALFQSDLFYVRLLSLFCGLASVIVTYLISQKLFAKKTTTYVATLVYALLFATPILEGNIANAENFMLLPTSLAAYLILSETSEKKKNRYIIIAGLLLSISLTTKVVAVFDFAAFLLFMIFVENKIHGLVVKRLALFIISFTSLLVFFAGYFLMQGAFSDFINGVFLQNVSYVGEQYGSPFPASTILIKTILLVIFTIIMYRIRNKITRETLFVYLWLGFGIYSAFFSDRPYTHYLLVLLPAFSFLVGNFMESSKKTRMLSAILIVVVVTISYNHFGTYQKNVKYYQNFVNFILGTENVPRYYGFFDRNTPRDYAVAEFIKRNTTQEESIFLMSDSAQIYQLSNKLPPGKYVVYYHITYYPGAAMETLKEVDSKKPKYIIKTVDESRVIKPLLSSYQLKYIIEGAEIYERQI